MSTEHPAARSARPEVEPRDAPDSLHPEEPAPAGSDGAEQAPDDLGREETPKPQPSPGS